MMVGLDISSLVCRFSGVMDPFAYEMACALVGNDGGQAVIEATFLGPKIKFHAMNHIAVTGGHMQPRINDRPIAMWRSHEVYPGDVLSFGGIESGCRTYIAFRGGIQVDDVMGSKSDLS